MPKFIPVCVKRENSNNYVGDSLKPVLKIIDTDDIIGAPSYNVGGGTAMKLQNFNSASAIELVVAESISALSTAIDSTSANLFGIDQSSGALTAFAGGGQSSAVAISKYLTTITVSASAGDSVKLPAVANLADKVIVVINNGANSANVFPVSGEKIFDATSNSANAVNIGIPVPNGTFLHFWCNGIQWYTIVAKR